MNKMLNTLVTQHAIYYYTSKQMKTLKEATGRRQKKIYDTWGPLFAPQILKKPKSKLHRKTLHCKEKERNQRTYNKLWPQFSLQFFQEKQMRLWLQITKTATENYLAWAI